MSVSPPPALLLPSALPIGVTVVHLTWRCTTPVRLAPFAGFSVYGALKRAAVGVGCRYPSPCPQPCARPDGCRYGRLFGQGHRPAAFALHLVEPGKTRWRTGATLTAEVRCFGGADSPYGDPALAVAAAQLVTTLGMPGGPPGTVTLEAAEVGAHTVLPGRIAPHVTDVPARLVLATPIRLAGGPGGPKVDTARTLRVERVARAGLFRLRTLARHFGDGMDTLPHPEVAEAAMALRLSEAPGPDQLRDVAWARPSGKRTKPADGVTGHLTMPSLVGSSGAALRALFAAMETVHLGKLTSNGYGQLRKEMLGA